MLILFKSSDTKCRNDNFYIFTNKKTEVFKFYFFDFKTGIFLLILF